MKKIWLLFLFFTPCMAMAGSFPYSIGGRSPGMGGFSVSLMDVWAAENNVAALAFVKKPVFGAYLENRFLLEELSYKAFAGSLPISKGSFGMSAGQYGYQLFNDNKVGLSYSRLLSENISMGVQLNYFYTKIAEGYGSKSALSGNIGIIAKITDQLHLGTYIVNPTKVKLSDYQDERHPTILKMGFSYTFSKKLIVGAEVDKNMEKSSTLRSGIEYHPIDILYLRAGISTAPTVSTFGLGLKFHNFQFDFASSFHSVLGFSPHISLLFSPNQFKKDEDG